MSFAECDKRFAFKYHHTAQKVPVQKARRDLVPVRHTNVFRKMKPLHVITVLNTSSTRGVRGVIAVKVIVGVALRLLLLH